jgi:hypothetical protein
MLLHVSNMILYYIYIYIYIYQKVSVHLLIKAQKVTSNVQSVPRQSPDIYWHAELFSKTVFSIARSALFSIALFSVARSTFRIYSVMAIFCVFLYCNHQVHRDFLITLYVCVCAFVSANNKHWSIKMHAMNITTVHFNIMFLPTPYLYELRKFLSKMQICYLRFRNLKWRINFMLVECLTTLTDCTK